MQVDETQAFESLVYPPAAKRCGVIWESSNPTVLTVDKFGVATAHKAGTAEVTIYSWDDARPLSDNREQTYLRDGIKAVQQIEVF